MFDLKRDLPELLLPSSTTVVDVETEQRLFYSSARGEIGARRERAAIPALSKPGKTAAMDEDVDIRRYSRRTRVAKIWQIFGKIFLVFGCIGADLWK